jgi:hypothetical protein
LYGERIILCRRGNRIWAWPGGKLRALLARPDVVERLPVADRNYKLRPFALPMPEKQMSMLPALFAAKAEPAEPVDAVDCQVIDVEFTPFVAATMGLDGWTSKMWGNPEHKLVRVKIAGPDTALLLHMDKMAYSKSLPPSNWVATKAQQEDVVSVPPARYDQLVRALMGTK